MSGSRRPQNNDRAPESRAPCGSPICSHYSDYSDMKEKAHSLCHIAVRQDSGGEKSATMISYAAPWALPQPVHYQSISGKGALCALSGEGPATVSLDRRIPIGVRLFSNIRKTLGPSTSPLSCINLALFQRGVRGHSSNK